MSTVVMTARVDEQKRLKAKRILDRCGMTFTSYVNDSLDALIENNGPVQVTTEDDGKTEQEKMLERINRPENKEKIRQFFDIQKKYGSHESLGKYENMTHAEIVIEKARKKGWI